MDNLKTRWKGIHERLEARRKDLGLLEDYLHITASKLKELGNIVFARDILRYCEYLKFLMCFVTTDKTKHWLGLEVCLDELDSIYAKMNEELKSPLNIYLEDQNETNYDAADKAISSLHSKLHEFSFIEIKAMKIRSVSKFLSTTLHTEISDELLNELYKYLDTGVDLMNDEITRQYLEQVKNLHLEAEKAKTAAAYSAIIGPSLMGKTQVAFTLSNLINVIYLNFLTIDRNSIYDAQKIYTLFTGITALFKRTFELDGYELGRRHFDITAAQITSSDKSFYTLGLIYMILRTRKIREAQVKSDQSFSVKDWLLEIVSTKEAIIPSMNIDQFRDKTQDIDFTKISVFIDELPRKPP